MSELEAMVNIGPALAQRLRTVGITDAGTLRSAGAMDATRRLEAAGAPNCTHTYLALEAALLGVRWTELPPDRRAELGRRRRNRRGEPPAGR